MWKSHLNQQSVVLKIQRNNLQLLIQAANPKIQRQRRVFLLKKELLRINPQRNQSHLLLLYEKLKKVQRNNNESGFHVVTKTQAAAEVIATAMTAEKVQMTTITTPMSKATITLTIKSEITLDSEIKEATHTSNNYNQRKPPEQKMEEQHPPHRL